MDQTFTNESAPKFSLFRTRTSPLIFYSVLMFFMAFADAIMSYYSPNFLENLSGSTLTMGLIMSTSSIVGIACDFIFGELFKGKHVVFFMKWAIIGGILFPVSYLLLPNLAPLFIISMAIWGVYYEMIVFSNFHFVEEFVPYEDHAVGWSYIQSLKSLGYLLGPIAASVLLALSPKHPLFASISLYAFILLGFAIFIKVYAAKAKTTHEPKRIHANFVSEFKVWIVLSKKIWPVLAFIFALTLLDATFWSVGAVLAEELRQTSFLGGLLITVSLIPSLLVSPLAKYVSKPYGKKRAAFALALLGGLILALAGFVNGSIPVFLSLIFVSSMFISLSYPEILATVEDYVSRLDSLGNQLIGLENSMTSLGYILGPILAGGIAATIGHRQTFGVMGAFVALVSLVALIVVPRKVKLPQQELHQIS